jgi:hypothetical protein
MGTDEPRRPQDEGGGYARLRGQRGLDGAARLLPVPALPNHYRDEGESRSSFA